MKKVFKLFSVMALAALPLVFTACGDDEEGENVVANEIKVTFGNASWTPAYTNAQLATDEISLSVAQVASNQYPIAYLDYYDESAVSTGTYTSNPSMEVGDDGMVSIIFGNPLLWYFESGNVALQGGNGSISTGDWWAKTISLKVTELDATALTASMTTTASMANFAAAFNEQGQLTTTDFDEMPSCEATLNVTNQTFTASAAKKARVTSAKAKLAK